MHKGANVQVVVGVLCALFLSNSLACSQPKDFDLKVTLFTGGLEMQNIGDDSIVIDDLTINNRDECSTFTNVRSLNAESIQLQTQLQSLESEVEALVTKQLDSQQLSQLQQELENVSRELSTPHNSGYWRTVNEYLYWLQSRKQTQARVQSSLNEQNLNNQKIRSLRENILQLQGKLKTIDKLFKLGDEGLHKVWVYHSLEDRPWPDEPITLKVGDIERWSSPCNIVRINVTTDLGSKAYSFATQYQSVPSAESNTVSSSMERCKAESVLATVKSLLGSQLKTALIVFPPNLVPEIILSEDVTVESIDDVTPSVTCAVSWKFASSSALREELRKIGANPNAFDGKGDRALYKIQPTTNGQIHISILN